MRILTNISKAELGNLTNQPTAKSMINKVKTEGVYIPKGNKKAAADFVDKKNNQEQVDSLEISDIGLQLLQKLKDNEKTVDSTKEIS